MNKTKVYGIFSDFAKATTDKIKLTKVIFLYTEICPDADGKRFGLPKYVEIRLHGLIQNWD